MESASSHRLGVSRLWQICEFHHPIITYWQNSDQAGASLNVSSVQTNMWLTFITAGFRVVVRWRRFQRQSDPLHYAFLWPHPPPPPPLCNFNGSKFGTTQVTCQQLTTLSLLFTPAWPCIRANRSPDVNIRRHLVTLHSDVCVGVQVNLNWAWISWKIKNILIGWQSRLAVWFQSDYAISNGPGPPTDDCSMEICLKDTP